MKNLLSLLSLLTLFFIGSCNKEYPAVTIGEEQINNVYTPFIKTKWGQLYPWNQYIPYSTNQTGRVHVGCTAIGGNWQPKPNGTIYNSDLDIFYNFSK